MRDPAAEPKELPLHFPDPRAEAQARAEQFRRLTSDERWGQIAALMAFGLNMAYSSPRRDAILQRWEAEEDEWRRIQKELFAKQGG